MARGLLKEMIVTTLAATCALSTTGCLALQDQPYVGDFPINATVNHPPVILESLVEPQRAGGGQPIIVRLGPDCPTTLTFRVRLYDTDVADVLYVRWFVDYDEKSNNGTVELNVIEPNTPTAGPVRNSPGVYVADLRTGARLSQPGLHIVEAMVADHKQYTTREEPFTLPEPGVVGAPSPRTTFSWFIRTETGSSCVP